MRDLQNESVTLDARAVSVMSDALCWPRHDSHRMHHAPSCAQHILMRHQAPLRGDMSCHVPYAVVCCHCVVLLRARVTRPAPRYTVTGSQASYCAASSYSICRYGRVDHHTSSYTLSCARHTSYASYAVCHVPPTPSSCADVKHLQSQSRHLLAHTSRGLHNI